MTDDVDPVLVSFAAEVGSSGPVAVRGGGTRWDSGGPLAAGAREVRAPTGIVSYQPDEMTVRVRAGTTVADLHGELAIAGQRTALPVRDGGTVGGALAVGESSIERLGRGLTRDSLLQAVYVSGEGRLVTAGGPTVKNVTGFDLARLLVGSLGTLGLLAEVILRTQPIPPQEDWYRSADLEPAVVLTSCPTATAILWDGSSTWVLLTGHRPDVDADRLRLSAGAGLEPSSPPVLPAHRWSRRPGELFGLDRSRTGQFVAEIGVGVVHAERPDRASARPDAVIRLEQRVKDRFDPTGRLNPGRRPGS